MLGLTMLKKLFSYQRQVDAKLLELAATLTDEELDAPIVDGQRSIRSTINHLAAVDWRWRIFVETGVPELGATPADGLISIAENAAFIATENASIARWLETRSDADLVEPISFIWGGQPSAMPPWHALLQLLMHGQQHRSELALAFTRLGKSPGDLDFIMYAGQE